jgi:hypothetical protein
MSPDVAGVRLLPAANHGRSCPTSTGSGARSPVSGFLAVHRKAAGCAAQAMSPLDADAAAMISGIHAARLLPGHRG